MPPRKRGRPQLSEEEKAGRREESNRLNAEQHRFLYHARRAEGHEKQRPGKTYKIASLTTSASSEQTTTATTVPHDSEFTFTSQIHSDSAERGTAPFPQTPPRRNTDEHSNRSTPSKLVRVVIAYRSPNRSNSLASSPSTREPSVASTPPFIRPTRPPSQQDMPTRALAASVSQITISQSHDRPTGSPLRLPPLCRPEDREEEDGGNPQPTMWFTNGRYLQRAV